jgi:hypothetical protein
MATELNSLTAEFRRTQRSAEDCGGLRRTAEKGWNRAAFLPLPLAGEGWGEGGGNATTLTPALPRNLL